ncbi:unnamed protein product [Chondrus crispus]|uniref:Uncharacterized protein n=1 Tax=Chondrus crispus TaxID=2769 RepID=R7QPK9_CHOCR|nr:unnamed protein product [Chondrus crispus]CDF39421.1 unnamed protein product [Chondrus crispus]|eukprot:XP_005719332.1 unnamed protein product [Chondrus crispus]
MRAVICEYARVSSAGIRTCLPFLRVHVSPFKMNTDRLANICATFNFNPPAFATTRMAEPRV